MNHSVVLSNMNLRLLPVGNIPPVVILYGASGTGKTCLLERIKASVPRSLQILEPIYKPGQPQPLDSSSWTEDCDLAVDELDHWEPNSLPQSIADLEAQAIAAGRTLILVLQSLESIDLLKLRFRTTPALMTPAGARWVQAISHREPIEA